MTKNNHIVEVRVMVPNQVQTGGRPEFEAALVNFLFGHDRIRPELAEPLSKRGVDLNYLASLSDRNDVGGICPSPSAWEFHPTSALVDWARERGVDFTSGGRVAVTFHYSDEDATREGALRLDIGVPEGLRPANESEESALGDVTRALFGDCSLPERAQSYLRAHGVDLPRLVSENTRLLRDGAVPPTSRVSPEIAEVLQRHGFQTDKIGTLRVNSIHTAAVTTREEDGTLWSKTTCC